MPEDLLYYIQQKVFFRAMVFLYYSPYPNLEGIKDVLSYKFTIGKEGNTVNITSKLMKKNSPD